MHEYLESLCKEEDVTVEPGVIALVVRAGGGSVRDSLSLLDQLMAGSDDRKVSYDRAVALLGFTHGTLLDSVIDAFAAKNPAAVFASVDSVIQTGQDPRRFVEDLLERLRDLIVVLAVGNNAGSVLRGLPNDEIEKLTTQAFGFGMASLTHASEVVSETLNSMSGATSPKLQLELMCARVLVPASSDSEAGSLARLDRLERRIGVSGTSEQASSPVAVSQPAVSKPASAPANPTPTNSAPTEAIVVDGLTALTTQSFKDSWAEILSVVNKESKAAWMVAFALQVIDFDATTTVLTLKFPNERDLETFKTSGNSTDVLRRAINSVLGVTVKFKPQFGPPATAPIAVVAEAPASESSNPVASAAALEEQPASTDVEDDAVALLEEEAAAVESAPAPVVEKPKAKSRNSKLVDEDSRYGESLLREMLGAEPVDDKKNGR
jgi:DNA polymerase-3 subunit gamma/tau